MCESRTSPVLQPRSSETRSGVFNSALHSAHETQSADPGAATLVASCTISLWTRVGRATVELATARWVGVRGKKCLSKSGSSTVCKPPPKMLFCPARNRSMTRSARGRHFLPRYGMVYSCSGGFTNRAGAEQTGFVSSLVRGRRSSLIRELAL